MKELSRRMSTPKECDWVSAKRLGRYLIDKTRSVLHFGDQEYQTGVTVWSDTDFAGCRNERKSTSGGVIMFGGHCLKSWSLTQKVIASSSGEAQYYGLVKSGSQGLGIRGLLGDLGVERTVVLNIGASAAIGIASRRGLGKVRHNEVSQLWLQQRVANGNLSAQKVDGVSNLADALTKHLQKGPLASHMESVRLEIRDGRRPLMPVCDSTDRSEVSAAVSFESDERFCQVALACNFVNIKGLRPERGSNNAGRLFDLCCMDCKDPSYLSNACCLEFNSRTKLLTCLYF